MFKGLFDSLSNAFSSVFSGIRETFKDELPDLFETTPEQEFLDSIREDLAAGLERNLHPVEMAQEIGYVGDAYPGAEEDSDQLLDQYRDDLIDKLDLSLENADNNWTERETYGSYEELIDYLRTFNGGFPDEDIIDIVLTEEGYQLYVEIDSA